MVYFDELVFFKDCAGLSHQYSAKQYYPLIFNLFD
jgi:hypothetical protein